MSDLTQLLHAIERGEMTANDLLPIVYDELRNLAAGRLAQERVGHTLQPTALVHEAYLRLIGDSDEPRWQNRAHFFAAAAEAMRRILIDQARHKNRKKRGGDHQRVDLATIEAAVVEQDDDILAIDEALELLAQEDPQKAELVKLRYFAGLSVEDSGKCLGVSRATADRYWAYARAWLYERLTK